jgi:DNA repair photolyase
MTEIKKFWALYNTVWGWEWSKCLYPTRLDTYWQWCSHNCSYCYARALLDFRWLWHPNNPKFIDLKTAYKIIATEIPKDQITRLW